MIHAVIPTRSASKVNKNLLAYLKEAGINILVVEKKASIFEAFTVALKYIDDSDIVILCHDDIEIWSDKRILKIWLETYLRKPEIGFAGIAGTTKMPSNGVWWEGIREPNNNLRGMAFHPIPGNKELTPLSYYGSPFTYVEVLDGVFLATTGAKLKEAGTEKPYWLPEESNWDFYDISMTYNLTKKGYKNIILPIQIFHESPGVPRNTWNAAREAFVKRFMS